MAEFDVEEFCGRDFGRIDLRKLKREELLAVATFCELDIPPETKKLKIMEILMLELQLEDPVQKEKEREEQRKRAEAEERLFQLELAQVAVREQERKIELARVSLEQEKLRATNNALQRQHEVRFEVSSCLRLMPKFNRDDVGSFFEAFEKIAKELEWPEDKWALLIQTVLEGKAQEAYAALDHNESREYDAVRKVVLAAYEEVPEAYRQKFRSLQRKPGETFLDLARQQEAVFDRWLVGTDTHTFQNLRQLMLVEQFKNSLPRHMEIHLNESAIFKLKQAAMAADSYELSHKEVPGRGKFGRHEGRQAVTTTRPAEAVPVKLSPSSVQSQGSWRRNEKPYERSYFPRNDVICNYCKKPGHMKSNCLSLKKRNGEGKAVGLVSTCAQIGPCEADLLNLPSGPIVKELEGFVSKGAISGAPGDKMVPISILRDTGATLSLLLQGVIDLPPATYLQTSTPVQGVGGGFVSAPLHRVYLESNVVNGLVVVAVIPSLPINGVALLLGNDLAGTKVCVTPVMSETPCEVSETLTLEKEYPEVFTACVVTRAQARVAKKGDSSEQGEPGDGLKDTVFAKLAEVSPCSQFSREILIKEQESDPSVAPLRQSAGSVEEMQHEAEGFFLQGGVLMRKWRPRDRPADETWVTVTQIVLPKSFRKEVLRLAHEVSMAGHFGIRKTQEKINRHFYWPKMHEDVVSYCRSCHACQVVGKPNQTIPVAPLCPVPVMEEPFSRVLIDCVGPLPKTKKGNEYLLTIMDVSTRFPEAVPLRSIKTKVIVEALLHFFSRVGLPLEVQHDRGSNFTSGVFQEVMHELGVKQIMSSAYHPQSQGAIERYHQTLKSMIKTYCVGYSNDWDVAMPFLLFAIRDSVNEATGFSPFELVYGHQVRGPLKMAKEQLLQSAVQTDAAGGVLQYVASFKDRLYTACDMARSNLQAAKGKMKAQYDKKAVQRTFKAGDLVLVLLPMGGDKLGVKFYGPYKVIRKVSECNYVVETPDRRQKSRLCHINLLKPYYSRDTPSIVCVTSQTAVEEESEDDGVGSVGPVTARLKNSSALANLRESLSHLTTEQREEVVNLVDQYKCLFSDTPGLTNLITHDVDTNGATPIKQHPYRINPQKWAQVKPELQYMLDIGVIEQGVSEWSSPLVPVPKPDLTVRPCIDYRKVNNVTKTDAYPIPRLEDCIDKIGHAQYVSKFDLLKGYWQVPLTERAKDVSAFVTPECLYRCQVLPFGMKNAPATFQRLMNLVTAGLQNTVTYLDDVVCYSSSWSDHMDCVKQLFDRLMQAGLVINLAKSEFGKGQVTYLGHQVGQGSVSPRTAKVQAILDLPVPKTKRQLMRLLGMCGFYRRFVANFAAVTSPLTDLLKQGVKFRWSADCQKAVGMVKAILASEPVLAAPDFDFPFKLAVDACDVGVGAVLLQTDVSGIDRPIAYFSKKLNRHQKRYSTIEKEALALVLAVQHFEVYVSSAGGELVVLTDHNPLTFLAKFKTSSQRVFRWSLILQPYNLTIVHLPGKENVIADTLSRGG